MKTITGALRIFLRYAAAQGLCDSRLAAALRSPRMYAQESLPSAPGWSDVQQILATTERSEEHTSELQSLMRISYAVFCLKKKRQNPLLNVQTLPHNLTDDEHTEPTTPPTQ